VRDKYNARFQLILGPTELGEASFLKQFVSKSGNFQGITPKNIEDIKVLTQHVLD